MGYDLKTRLAEWVKLDLISAEQAQRISAHEEERDGGRPWVVYGIAGIGITTVTTGVISLVAANWGDIPAWFKLLSYFLLQLALGAGFLRVERRLDVWREVLLTGFSLFFFAGIGLCAQVFNLRGDGWQASLLWLVLTLPAALNARSRLLNHLWMFVSLITAGIWAAANDVYDLSEFARACFFAAVPLLLSAVGFLSQRYRVLDQHFREATLVWGLGFILLVGTPIANFLWLENPASSWRSDAGFLAVPWAALLLAVWAAVNRPDVSRVQKLATAATLLVAGLYGTLPLFVGGGEGYGTDPLMKLFGAVGFIAVWAFAAGAAALAAHKRLFDIASFIIAGRFIMIYFEVFQSLAFTGFGLIISGLVILGVALFWYRSRRNLTEWLGAIR